LKQGKSLREKTPMFDYLVCKLYEALLEIPDHRKTEKGYPLADTIMSAFARFSLKDPSVLSFIDNCDVRKENLE
jgi:hypothetical protein